MMLPMGSVTKAQIPQPGTITNENGEWVAMAKTLRRKWKEALLGGRLADFSSFGLITLVWWELRCRREGRPSYVGDRQPDNISTLSDQLIKAIANGDSKFLHLVADAVDLLHRDRNVWVRPDYRLDFWLLTYFLDGSPGTIDELVAWCAEKMGWKLGVTIERGACDKQIRRRCKVLELKIAPSKPGPKR